jgi:hypothetical protein
VKSFLRYVFIDNWRRKLLALASAVIIWLLVANSITITQSYPNVPIRVTEIPDNKTIEGLLPNGILSSGIPITLTGRKEALEALNPEDLEITISAANRGDQWTTEIGRRNLVSLNPDIDLKMAVSDVAPAEVTITLSNLITDKIPVTVMPPVGEPPEGWQYLDLWPQQLYQTVSGPEEQVHDLKAEGLKLTFDLSNITAEELNTLYENELGLKDDEVRYFVPTGWKRVAIPFQQNQMVTINDPDAAFLHLDFLKQELLPLDTPLALSPFFPLRYSETLNPDTYSLVENSVVTQTNGIYQLTLPLYTRNVSRFFLDTVRDYIAISIVVAPRSKRATLAWSIQFVDPAELEEEFIAVSMAHIPTDAGQQLYPEMRESSLRERFRMYMREFTLYTEEGESLDLVCELTADSIEVRQNQPAMALPKAS